MADTGYLAGFFDGEGCVHIGSFTRKGRRYHRLTVTVSQNDRRPLDMLSAAFGGSVRLSGSAFVWYLVEWPAIAALKSLLPHLVVKREQAELAIWFQRTFEGQRRGARRITAYEFAERDAFAEAVKEVRIGGFVQ